MTYTSQSKQPEKTLDLIRNEKNYIYNSTVVSHHDGLLDTAENKKNQKGASTSISGHE